MKPLLGNSGDPRDETVKNVAVDLEVTALGDDSKTVYINDSYSLDSIPFDIVNIIDTDNSEDTD